MTWVQTAQIASGIAAATGLFLTTIGLCLTAYQIRRTRLVNDLQVVQKFFEIANRLEHDLSTLDGDEWSFAFNEFLTFLEIHCAAYNRRQFGSGCRDIIRHKLEDSYIELDSEPSCHARIQSAIDRASTFDEFRSFVEKNTREIAQRREERNRAIQPQPDQAQQA